MLPWQRENQLKKHPLLWLKMLITQTRVIPIFLLWENNQHFTFKLSAKSKKILGGTQCEFKFSKIMVPLNPLLQLGAFHAKQ